MKGLLGIVLIGALLPCASGVAGERGVRETNDAHWARLSDRAQIELIVDEMRGTAAPAGIPTKASDGETTSSQASRADRVAIRIDGSQAVITTARGERLVMEKSGGRWILTGGGVAETRAAIPAPEPVVGSGMSTGASFAPEPMSREFGVERLTRTVTETRLQRTLFSTPEKTASWYRARYSATAPFVRATYVQFVTDPGWNRLVYGNLNRWIRTLAVPGPSAIAVDSDGRVFVGESASNAIAVYHLAGEGDDMQLQFLWRIPDVVPTDIALDDRGTPLVTGDDLLYVADAVHHRVLCYALENSSATLTSSWEGYETPSVVAVGRRNGASSGMLYVVDRIGKRLRVFQRDGASLTEVGAFTGSSASYLKSVKVDHFGGVYAVDNTGNALLKFSSTLELLDTAEGVTFDALAAVEIPFGRIEVDGEPPVWAGFDQVFAVERWSPTGGAQRLALGIRLKDVRFASDGDRGLVVNKFTLTDAADLRVRVLRDGETIRTLAGSWMVAGGKSIVWDRRDEAGRYIPPGTYRYEITARSAYRDAATVSIAAITMPLYYQEDCGSVRANDDPHVVRGQAVRWGALPSESANRDPERVLYRFTGLRAGGKYEVAAEFGAGDGEERLQVLVAGGRALQEPVRVGAQPVRTGYVPVPADCISGGEVTIGVERRGGPDASVTQLWLKETGSGISTQPVDASLPDAFALEQNYPNPFNPVTTIRFALPEPAQVTLKVYSITGQEVATLVNDRREAGTYAVPFDALSQGKTLASGVYFYQLRAGSFTAARKFILLK
jgi:hypothetical protein